MSIDVSPAPTPTTAVGDDPGADATTGPLGALDPPSNRLGSDAPLSRWRRLRWPALATVSLQVVLATGDRLPSVDGVAYFEAGRNFLAGKGYVRQGRPELHFPPLTPLSLGWLEKVTGSEMHALRLWNLTWGLATVALVVALAHRLSRRADVTVATAWIAGTVAGLGPLFVRHGGGSEAPATAFLLGAALVAITALGGDRRRANELRTVAGLALAGALVGLAYLSRPESLLPGAMVGIGLVVATVRSPGRVLERLRRVVVRSAAFGAALLLLLVPYLTFLHAHTGSWAPTAKSQDASIQAWRAVAENDRLERDRVLYALDRTGTRLGYETRSLTKLARQDPSGWLGIVGINARVLMSQLALPTWGFGPAWALVPVLLLPGALALAWRRRRQRGVMLLAAMAAGPLVTCLVFFTQPRYLIVTTAVLTLFGTWGMVEWAEGRSRRTRRIAWGLVGLLMATSTLTALAPFVPGLGTKDPMEQRTAGLWIERHTPVDARIMTRSFHVQAYARRTVVALPSSDFPTMVRFARRMGVSYIVADESTIRRRRPELYPALLSDWTPPGLELVHEFREHGQDVRIFELDPPAPSTDRPPLPLGYVSD